MEDETFRGVEELAVESKNRRRKTWNLCWSRIDKQLFFRSVKSHLYFKRLLPALGGAACPTRGRPHRWQMNSEESLEVFL